MRAVCPDPARFRSRLSGTDLPEPGDVIEEVGPRIGTRLYVVTDTRPGRKWLAIHVRQVDVTEYTAAVIDGATGWRVDRVATPRG